MVRLAVWALLLVACGRVGFDEASPADSAGGSSDSATDATDCIGTSGLLGVWPMDLDDVTSTTVFDRSDAARHATFVGSPVPAVRAGRIGESLDFAGTNAHLALPALPVVTTAGAATTFAFWFYTDDAMPDVVLLYSPTGPVAMPPRYGLWLNYPRLNAVALCINTGTSDCWGFTDPGLIGRWVHVTAVLVNGSPDGGSLFIDGVPATMSCLFGSCNSARTVQNPITLSGPDLTYSWHGKLDDARIYDRALSPAEIANLYGCLVQ